MQLVHCPSGFLPLEQAVFAPVTAEPIGNEWEIRNPDEATEETGLGGIKEALAR